MRAALQAQCHYLDLGGLFHTTRRQLRLDREFRRRLAAGRARHGQRARRRQRAGPRRRRPVAERARHPRLQRRRRLHTLRGAPRLRFRAGHGARRADPAAHGVHGRPLPRRGAVVRRGRRVVRARHAEGAPQPALGGRDPASHLSRQGHPRVLRSRSPTTPSSSSGSPCSPISASPTASPARAAWLRATSSSTASAACRRRRRSSTIATASPSWWRARTGAGGSPCGTTSPRGRSGRPPLSAVARHTGFPPAIVAGMILDGTIRSRGVLPPERCVPVTPLLAALAARGMTGPDDGHAPGLVRRAGAGRLARMKRHLHVSAAVLLASAAVSAAPSKPVTPAELVLTDGRIWTADPAQPWAEAVAVRGSGWSTSATPPARRRSWGRAPASSTRAAVWSCPASTTRTSTS